MFKEELKDFYMTIDNRLNTILRCTNDVELYVDFIEKLGRDYKDKEKLLDNIKNINSLVNAIKNINYLDFKDMKGSDKND